MCSSRSIGKPAFRNRYRSAVAGLRFLLQLPACNLGDADPHLVRIGCCGEFWTHQYRRPDRRRNRAFLSELSESEDGRPDRRFHFHRSSFSALCGSAVIRKNGNQGGFPECQGAEAHPSGTTLGEPKPPFPSAPHPFTL